MTPEQIATMRDLLLRWQAGKIDADTVLNAAESMWEHGFPWPTYDHTDHRSIAITVLHVLEALYAQLVFREDIPALLAFSGHAIRGGAGRVGHDGSLLGGDRLGLSLA